MNCCSGASRSRRRMNIASPSGMASSTGKAAHFFSKGPKLSVMLEVNGVPYGPSPVFLNRYDPDWNYEFPRPCAGSWATPSTSA